MEENFSADSGEVDRSCGNAERDGEGQMKLRSLACPPDAHLLLCGLVPVLVRSLGVGDP